MTWATHDPSRARVPLRVRFSFDFNGAGVSLPGGGLLGNQGRQADLRGVIPFGLKCPIP